MVSRKVVAFVAMLAAQFSRQCMAQHAFQSPRTLAIGAGGCMVQVYPIGEWFNPCPAQDYSCHQNMILDRVFGEWIHGCCVQKAAAKMHRQAA